MAQSNKMRLYCLVQEGGGVSKENSGRDITASMTSRHTSVIFKMARKVALEEPLKNVEFSLERLIFLLWSVMLRFLLLFMSYICCFFVSQKHSIAL